MFTAKIDRTFPIDQRTMWQLWTQPDHMARWFRPSTEHFAPSVASVDLRIDGAVRIEMLQHDGVVHAASGQFVEIDEPSRLSFTWQWDGSDAESLVEITFSAEPSGGTSVAITHTRLESQADVDRHTEGWVGCLQSLAATS